jgi:hypothetical protein
VAVDKYAGTIQPTGENVIEVLHGLGTTDVVVQAWHEATGRAIVGANLTVKYENTITIGFSPPIRDPFSVVVIG